MEKDCKIECEAGVDKGQSIFKANQKNVSNLFKVCFGIEKCWVVCTRKPLCTCHTLCACRMNIR